jgi:ABC-type multidrug transport system permease subunit
MTPPLTTRDIAFLVSLLYVNAATLVGSWVYILASVAGSSRPFSDALYFVTIGIFGLNL